MQTGISMDRCWSCLQEIEDDPDAIDAENGVNAVCRECWFRMTPYERIRAYYLLQSGFDTLAQNIAETIGSSYPFGNPPPGRN